MSSDAAKAIPPKPAIGAPCWIEIMSAEPKKLKEFYEGLFPAWKWLPEKVERVVQYKFEQPEGLSGGIVKLPEGHKPGEQPMGIGYTVYYYVDSIEEFDKKVTTVGGVQVLGKTKEQDHGWFANYKDPEGNRFGIFEANWAAMGAPQ